jgi:hypothetical protein
LLQLSLRLSVLLFVIPHPERSRMGRNLLFAVACSAAACDFAARPPLQLAVL